VRWSGRGYETWLAWRERRRPCPLFHSALEVGLDGDTYAVEMGPAWGATSRGPDVIGGGAVGLRPLGRSRLFRYEIRRSRGGAIPDRDEAVGGARTVSTDVERARKVLAAVPDCPAATWGRDELSTGDMWNSNSLVAFVLMRAGLDARELTPPEGGRAPGWLSGVVAAAR
jgi:hypothetical protein